MKAIPITLLWLAALCCPASVLSTDCLNIVHAVTSSGNTTTVNTDYCGNVVYENGALKRILIDGGYVTMSGQTPVYHYYLQDHLGNNRVVLSQAGAIEQVTHYYPFGTVIAASTNGESQPYKYNGKELDRMNGLDWYDYGARFYDPVLCRWHVMDPLCEKDYGISPYAYCHNDPVCRIDPDGMDDYYTLNGFYLYSDNKDTDNIIIRNQALFQLKQISGAEWIIPDVNIKDANISAAAYSNIYTDILMRAGYDVSLLYNNRISVIKLEFNTNGGGYEYELADVFNHENRIPWNDAPIAEFTNKANRFQITAYAHPMESEERECLSTRSNVESILGVHEFSGHGIHKLKEQQHWRILNMQRNHKSWGKVTKELKDLYRYLEKTKTDYKRP